MVVDYLRRIGIWLTDLIWPERCASCGRLGTAACAGCLAMLAPARTQRCPGCRRPSREGLPCPGCHGRTMTDRVIAVTVLEGAVEPFVHAFKYRNLPGLAVPLADRLCTLAGLRPATREMFGSNPLIVPVPLFPTRLRERGYNQAELLAHRIAAVAAMPCATDRLVRIRATPPQVGTSGRAQRRDNMQGAFAVPASADVRDRDIVLVDDVTTTGATLDDCARALKEAGARSVAALTLAHG